MAQVAYVQDFHGTPRRIDSRLLQLKKIAENHGVQLDFVLRAYQGFPRAYASQLVRCNGILTKVSFCENPSRMGRYDYWHSKIPKLGEASFHLHCVIDKGEMICFIFPASVTKGVSVFSIRTDRSQKSGRGAPRKVDWFYWLDRWDIIPAPDEFNLVRCPAEL